MSRYIDAENLKGEINDSDEFDGIGVKYYIDHEPTADVQEVKHGEWKNINKTVDDVRCSVCGLHPLADMDMDSVWYWSYLPKFCPNCGAKMDKETNT